MFTIQVNLFPINGKELKFYENLLILQSTMTNNILTKKVFTKIIKVTGFRKAEKHGGIWDQLLDMWNKEMY